MIKKGPATITTNLSRQEVDAAMILLTLRYGPPSHFDIRCKSLFGETSMDTDSPCLSATTNCRSLSYGSDFSTCRSTDSTTPDSIQNGAESRADSGFSGYVHKKYKRKYCSLDKVKETSAKKIRECSTQTDGNVTKEHIKEEYVDEDYSEDEDYEARLKSFPRNNAALEPNFVVRAGSSRGGNNNVVINRKTLQNVLRSARDNDLIPIGRGKVKVPAKTLRKIKWCSYSLVTRGLLEAVFSEEVLKTHSLTGKKSNAFPDKQPKSQLDPVLVNEIVLTVMEICDVPKSVVRLVITTTCSDKAKKKKENIDPEF